MEELNVVNDTQEPVVEVQEPATNEVPESVQEPEKEVADSEVTTEQEPKKKQSREENAKFKEVRQKAAQEAQDKLISEMYGQYGIHTKAEYDAAMAKQREAELAKKAKDSDDPMQFIEQMKAEWEKNDPRLKEYESMKTDMTVAKELKQLNTELESLGLDTIADIAEIATLPSSDLINNYISKGNTLAEAYFLANKAEIIKAQSEKIQQNTIKKIQANGNSPGPLADTGEQATVFTKEQVDAMSQAEVNKNYDLIMKSMKSW